MVERFREKLSNEKLADRLARIIKDAESEMDRAAALAMKRADAPAARLANARTGELTPERAPKPAPKPAPKRAAPRPAPP